MLEKLVDPTHPIWMHIKVIIMTGVILLVFQFAYQHGLGIVDVWPVIIFIGSMYGIDIGQRVLSATIKKDLER